MLLNIFHTGGLTLGVTLVFVVLQGIFISQGVKHSKVEGYAWYKSPFIYFGSAAVLVAYIVALIAIGSDYKGV